MSCPNINLESWKTLEASVGTDRAYYLWDKYGEDVPDLTYLNTKLVNGFLKDFNITATEYNDLKEDIGLDAVAASDLVSKAIAYNKGESITAEVAYFAYNMLGKQNNKLRSELRYLVNKWDGYKERFEYHANILREKEGFNPDKQQWKNKIRDLVILDFLQEKIQQHYLNPQEFIKSLDTKWTSEDFSMWDKIISWIEGLLSSYSSKYNSQKNKLDNLGISIADEVLNQNYEYFNYDLKEDQIQKYYNQTISSDPFAKELVEFGQKEVGLVLTGSLALRRAGEVYRTLDETLHDIDWVVPYETTNTEENQKVLDNIRKYQGTDKNAASAMALSYIEDLSWFRKFKEKYPSYKMVNGFYGAEHNKYESLTVQGVIDGKFYTENGFHEEKKSFYKKDPKTKKAIKVTEVQKVKHKKGDWIKDTGYVIDFFVRLEPHQEQHENYFKLWKEIMIAKLKMGRDKDFTDWKAFVPYLKSKDSFNFNYEGFRHINYGKSQSNAFEETEVLEPAKEPALLLQLEGTESSKASPETIAKIKEAAKKMGINIQELAAYAKATGLNSKGINAVADLAKGIIAIATGKEDVALTEEMVHLAYGMLEQTNPKMVTEMIAKIDRFQIYKKTLVEYKDNKNYQLSNGKPDIRKIKIEAVGKLLAEVIVYENEGSTEFPELRLEENQSFLRRMWNRIMDFFSDTYKKSNINIFEEAGAKIMAGEAGTIEDIKSGEIYYQLSSEQSEFNTKREETNNLIKKVYGTDKTDPILLDSEEANNWYEIKQPDGTYGKILKRVTDRVQAWYKKRFPGKIFSKEEQEFNELKRTYGLAGHADFEEIHSRYYNPDGTRRENPLPRPKQFKLESQAMYDKLETYYVDLIESLKGPNGENPAVYSEVVIYDKKEKEAGTLDFLAIDHTGKAHIFDWKFMHIKGEDVAWFKQGAFNIQLGTYKRILKENYGIKEFGMIRAIPISMEFSKENPKVKDSKLILSAIAIGSVDKSKLDPINELHLIPVSEQTESTGEKALDEVISNLNALLAQVEKQEATDETDREFKFARMNEIRKAVRIIQGTHNLMPLLEVIETTRKSGEATLNDYNAIYKDRPATSEDSTNKELSLFSEEMQNYLDSATIFGTMSDKIGDLVYNDSMVKDANTEEQKEYLANVKEIKENLRKESEDIRKTAVAITTAKLDFADKHIGQRNLVTGLTMAEAVVKGLSSMFRGVSELPMASLELLTKLTRNAQGKASKESLESVDKLMNIRKKLMERGGDIRSIVRKIYQKDEKGGIVNKIIYQYQKEFNETVDKKAEEGGDMSWLKQNIDIEGYKKEADEVIKSQIDRINKLQYPGSQQEVENRIDKEIQLVKDKYDIDSITFNGWNNYIIKRHPLEKWQSDEYLDVKKDADLFELYTLINEINSEAKDSGYISGMVSKTFLPFIRKSLAEELTWNNSLTVMSNFADRVSNSLKLQPGEVGYGNINQITGELENSIPKYYTHDFTYKDGVNDYSDVSEDIFKNMILYVQNVNKYKYLSEIEGQLKLVKSVEELKGSIKTDLSGDVIRVDGIIKEDPNNEENLKIYDDFLRTLLYGQKYVLSDADTPILKGIRKGINKLIGKEVFKLSDEVSPKSLIKTIDAANRGFRLKALGFNVISGAVNMFGGNIQVATQAGNYFKAREFLKNEKKLLSQNFDSAEDKKMFAELMNTFMPLKEDPATEEYKKAGMSTFTNTNLSDILMIAFRKPEILMEKAIFMTLLQNSMIENGKIVNIKEFVKSKYKDRYSSGSNYSEIKKKINDEVEELKKTRSIDAIKKLENGKLVIPGLDLNDQTEVQRLTNLSRMIARNATGGMSDGDKNKMALSVWTNSMMVFKGWIPKLMDTRFSEFRKVSDDFSVTIGNDGVSQGQKYDVGRIRLFGGVLMNMIHDKSLHLVNIISVNDKGIAQLDKMYEEYAKKYEDSTGKKLTMTSEDFKDMIVNNLRNQLKEFGILASMIGVMLSLGFIAPDDDDDKAAKNAHRFAQKVVDKFISELSFFYNPLEIEKLLEGGMFPAMGLVSDFTTFANNFMAEITGEDFSENTKTSEEVRKKAQPIKYAMKMAPVSTQVVTWLSIVSSDFAKEYDVTISAKSGIK